MDMLNIKTYKVFNRFGDDITLGFTKLKEVSFIIVIKALSVYKQFNSYMYALLKN